MIVHELDVALTDYGLAIECFLFCWFIYRRKSRDLYLRNWISIAFCSLGLASFFGGTVHGFFNGETSNGYRLLWPLTLMLIGSTACSAIIIGLELFKVRIKRLIVLTAIGVTFLLYGIAVFFLNQSFRVAILFYVPAAVFLLFASCYVAYHNRVVPALAGTLGLMTTLIAPIVQQIKLSVPLLGLSYNSVFHILQAIALTLVFWSAQWYLAKEHSTP